MFFRSARIFFNPFDLVNKMTLPLLVGNLVMAGFVLVLVLVIASGIRRAKDRE